MILDGLALATLTGTGFYLVFRRLPKGVKKFLQKHYLLTDIVACLLTYIVLGGTLVALFAAAFLGIIISILLTILHNKNAVAYLEMGVKRLDKTIGQVNVWLHKKFPPESNEEPQPK